MGPLSGSNSVVECDLAKVEVAGSNPVSRSSFRSSPSPGSSMRWAKSLPRVLFMTAAAVVLSGCGSGNHRSLESVSVTPAIAASPAQFTASGIYSTMPTSLDITRTTTWCVGTPDGCCAGNIAIEANVTAGLAQCLSGYTGTVTILAGQPGPSPGPDLGYQLQPFGVAQLKCP